LPNCKKTVDALPDEQFIERLNKYIDT
jgi:hypothetical protein